MRVGMHEMHALRVYSFFRGNDVLVSTCSFSGQQSAHLTWSALSDPALQRCSISRQTALPTFHQKESIKLYRIN